MKEETAVQVDVRLIEAIVLVNEFFKHDYRKTLIWFHTENLNFGNTKPIMLFRIGRGHKALQTIKDMLGGNIA